MHLPANLNGFRLSSCMLDSWNMAMAILIEGLSSVTWWEEGLGFLWRAACGAQGELCVRDFCQGPRIKVNYVNL